MVIVPYAHKMRSALLTLLCLGGLALSCGKQKPVASSAPPAEHATLEAANRYDLVRDESRGGHTLERHVGKTDADLRQRLENESLSADSTYSDRATAEMAVAADIRDNAAKLKRWLERPGGHSNLVLDYDSDKPLGRSMRPGESQSFPCSHTVAVLKWVSPREYYVLTSYPDCWKRK
jgi:hypothetical protein